MKIVIAGGSGMIGTSLTASLLADGHDIVILTRRTTSPVGGQLRHAQWTGQAIDAASLVPILVDADAVVNLTGVPVGPWPWTPWRRVRIVDSRIGPTETLVAGLGLVPAERRPPVLVSISGTDAYTGLDAVPATEATAPAGGFLAEVCGRWEAAALTAETLGVRVAIVRTGFVIGRGTKMMRVFALPFRFGVGGPLGSGRQWMSWIHLDDLIGILRAAIVDPRYRGITNAVSPTPIREADFAAAVGRALHRPSRVRLPAPVLRLIGESSILALGSRRVLPTRALESGYVFRHADIDQALASAFDRSPR